MKLFTHNLLMCNKKDVKEGYPLKIEASKVEIVKSEFNPEFIKGILSKVNYDALREAVASLKRKHSLTHSFHSFISLIHSHHTENVTLPTKVTDEMFDNVEFLKLLHHVLLEIVVVEGRLICPESGRIFPISQGIPNMLLNEDEV